MEINAPVTTTNFTTTNLTIAGGNPVPVTMPTVISTVNSTSTILASSGIFTGTSEDVSQYSEIRVSVFASHVSATNGLSLQQSSNGTNWDIVDTYTIAANTGVQYSIPVGARYFRLVYTNTNVAQTSFRIQTMFSRIAGNPSSQRPQDARSNETDMTEGIAYLSGFNGTSWDRLRTTGTGTLLVSAAVTSNLSTAGTVAAGSVASNAPVRIGGMARTTNLTAVGDGLVSSIITDKVGRTVVAPHQIRDMVGDAYVTLTNSTTSTSLIPAIAATFNDIVGLMITNSSATTGTWVEILDVAAVRYRIWVPAGGGGPVNFPVPLKQAAVNTAWNARTVTATTEVTVCAQYVRNL